MFPNEMTTMQYSAHSDQIAQQSPGYSMYTKCTVHTCDPVQKLDAAIANTRESALSVASLADEGSIARTIVMFLYVYMLLQYTHNAILMIFYPLNIINHFIAFFAMGKYLKYQKRNF